MQPPSFNWADSVTPNHPLDESLDITNLQRPSSPSQSRFKKCSKAVVERRFSAVTSSYAHPISISRAHGRRFPIRLVRSASSTTSSRGMASITISRINELEGASGHLPDSDSFSSTTWRESSQGLDRQLDSPSLYSPSGLASFPKALAFYQGVVRILCPTSNYSSPLPSSKGPKCAGRQGFKAGSYQHRMVPRPGFLPRDVCLGGHPPQVDLFATRFNAQLCNFVSPCPDPSALYMDAFSRDWDEWDSIFLFPPFILLQKVVARLSV